MGLDGGGLALTLPTLLRRLLGTTFIMSGEAPSRASARGPSSGLSCEETVGVGGLLPLPMVSNGEMIMLFWSEPTREKAERVGGQRPCAWRRMT